MFVAKACMCLFEAASVGKEKNEDMDKNDTLNANRRFLGRANCVFAQAMGVYGWFSAA